MHPDYVHFFLGGDTAPSESHRSDHGAVVAAAAWPRYVPAKEEPLSDQEADWFFAPIYARVFTSQHKLTARQWSGFIHFLHSRFGFTKIVLDAGAGGGGVFVARELRSEKQLINGVETQVTPIGDLVDAPTLVTRGQFILHLWKRGDPGVESVWSNPTVTAKSLAGDELLRDGLYSSIKTGLDGQLTQFPAPPEDWFGAGEGRPGDRTSGWDEERKWALKNLDAVTQQLKGIVVAVNEETGAQQFTSRGARVFSSLGKDDLAHAFMYCKAGFLMWLRMGGAESLRTEDESGFMGG